MEPATSSILLFGGMAKERPYPGSTTVTTVNAGVVGLTRTLVEELQPIRVNSIHPGVVGDSPYWVPKEAAREKYASETPMGRLCRMDEIVDACVFLLENGGANGVELIVDGGWHTR
jgi:NAD(P)-dependent dehydrogenase (short-subunit alcohol dehydrogenase family)